MPPSARRTRVAAVGAAVLAGASLLVGGTVTALAAARDRQPESRPSALAPVNDADAWVQRFDVDVELGDVGDDGTFPGYDRSDLRAYADGTRSTHGGVYRPSSVNSVQDGVLLWDVPGGGVGSSVTVGPSAVGGEWSVRMRTESIEGMHIADMRWPDNDIWPGTDGSGGEIDFPEGDTDQALPYFAVVDDEGRTRNGKQAFNPWPHPRVPEPWTEWHTYTTQVVPGVSVTVYQDGVLIGKVTRNVPRTLVHEQFQVESNTPTSGEAGRVEVSAVAYSPVLDLSTVDAVAD